MKMKLNIYKRKVYIPKDIQNFPDNGKVVAYVSNRAILLASEEVSPEIILKELKSIELMVEGDVNGFGGN